MSLRRFMYVFVTILTISTMLSSSIAYAATTKVLTLKNSTISIYEGESKTLGISKNTTGSKVTFLSSKISIATVNSKGVITAKKAGKVTITAKAGSKKATCKVTVVSKVIKVTKLNFKEGSFTCIDQDYAYENPVTVSPSNATDKSVKYSSSDTSIVSVDSTTGAITGHKKGTAYITATAANGVKAVCEVEVSSYSYYDSTEYLNSQNKDLVEKDSTLKVKQGDISLGMSVDELQSEIGKANRIEDNEYGGKTYVYNSDYSSLLFVYVEGNEVVGYFTNASNFSCAGVSNEMTQEMVHEVSNDSDMWTVTDKYTVSVWYDLRGTGCLMAIFVTKPSFDQEGGADEYLQNPSIKLIDTMEKETLDLINGFRVREGRNPVQINLIASTVSRAHSLDMVVRGYADHITPEGITPWQRMNEAGISFTGAGEILSTISSSGVIYDFIGFMLSTGHRNIILDPANVYAGPGIAFINGEGAITVSFYY